MSKTNNKSSVRGPSVGSIKRDFKDVFGFAPDDKNIHKIATRVAAPGPDGSRSADPIYTKHDFKRAFQSLPNTMQVQLKESKLRGLYASPEPTVYSREQVHQAIEEALSGISIAA